MEFLDKEKPRIHSGDVKILSAEEVAYLAGIGKALSDPIRIQIINLLDQQKDICTCEFEDILVLGQSKISYHLGILMDAKIVDRTLQGTWSHYSLRFPGILDKIKSLVT